MNAEKIRTQYPETHKAIFESGVAHERDRFRELMETCGSDVDLLVESFLANRAVDLARQTRIEKLERENCELTERVFLAGDPTDAELHEYYAATPVLREEFTEVDSYVAFVHADRAGRARVHGRNSTVAM